MDGRIDNETKAVLFDALERMQAHGEQLRTKREQRLWKEINLPCKLSEAISRLSKDGMNKIRTNLDLKNLSSLKKGELASELVKLIPAQFEDVLYTFDKERYNLVKRIVENAGFIEDDGITFSKAQSLLEYSIVFPGIQNNHKVLVMPLELMNIFTQLDEMKLRRTVNLNTEWIKLTQGLLYYYGVMDSGLIIDRIKKLTGQEVDFLAYLNVLSSAMDYYGQIRYSAYGFCDHRIFDEKKIIDEQNMRENIDYYLFTKQQLLKAGEQGYIDRTPALNSFIRFLLSNYEFTNEETDEIAIQCINMIKMDAKSTTLIQYVQSWIEIPSFDMVQQLTGKIMELHNNTRMWVLKGYTPNELFQEEKKHLRPLPSEPFTLGKTDSNVIDMRTRVKVGRNDPCPCGSGKKYKKCCRK